MYNHMPFDNSTKGRGLWQLWFSRPTAEGALQRESAHEVVPSCRLSAKGSKTVMTVEYTLAFIAPVNRIIRGFIERGAEQGLSKNFGQVIEVRPAQTHIRHNAAHSHTRLYVLLNASTPVK